MVGLLDAVKNANRSGILAGYFFLAPAGTPLSIFEKDSRRAGSQPVAIFMPL